MYKLLLILKYLRKRRIAWVSLIAVMLCTTMVLVVISVMGGWLRMFRSSFHAVSGDIVVDGQSMVGFPHYGEMLSRITRLPEVKAAAPIVRTYGLVNIYGQIRKGVEVLGYPPNISDVNGFRDSLYREGGNYGGVLVAEKDLAGILNQPEPEKAAAQRGLAPADAAAYYLVSGKQAYKLDGHSTDIAHKYLAGKDAFPEVRVRGTLRSSGDVLDLEAITRADKVSFDLWPNELYLPPRTYKGDARAWPGMIVGSGVIGLKKDKNGNIERPQVMYDAYVDLTALPLDPGSALVNSTPARKFFWIIDDSRTKVWVYDSNTVYVPFEVLQEMLTMDGSDGRPKRASAIQIALKPGADLYGTKAKIQEIVEAVKKEKGWDVRFPVQVQTWEEVHATFIGAIEKEKGLVTMLFGMISIVAVFLIFCIFYMIVAEKTRDIGIIKSVGATYSGVAGIFLGYGMAIGIVGGLMGWGAGWLIVHYINQLHAMLGRVGIVIWNPEVYLFDTIPNTTNPHEVIIIVLVAIVASVIGALVPAIRAARMHPVEALRWE